MAGSAVEAVVPGNGATPGVHPSRARKKQLIEPEPATRFFLAKAGSSNGVPAFDRELASEGEAKIESLKTGQNYYAVVEWRGVADCSGKNPQVRREAVKAVR